jgi:polar amino acid transport system substrate-binding protein
VNEPGNHREGYVVDMLREIYQPLGFKVQLFIVPWSRCLEEVRIGRVTAVIGTDTEEAPDLIFPDATMGVYRPLFYTLAEADWTYHGIDALQEIRLGVVQDYSYSSELDTYIEDYHQTDRLLFAKGEQPMEPLLLALREERIEAFIENEFTVTAYFDDQPGELGLVREAGRLQTDDKMYVAFNPSVERINALAKHYDQRIDKLRKGGLLAELLNNYGLKDWLVKPLYQSLQGRSEEKQH